MKKELEVMVAGTPQWGERWEDLLASLTVAAYHVALKHQATPTVSSGKTESFIDVELKLWNALRGVLDDKLALAPGGSRVIQGMTD